MTDRRIMSLSEAIHRGKYLVNVAADQGAVDKNDGMDILTDIAIAAFEEAAKIAEEPTDQTVPRSARLVVVERIRALATKTRGTSTDPRAGACPAFDGEQRCNSCGWALDSSAHAETCC